MRNEEKKENYRNEWKYLISTSEKELLKLRLKPFLVADPHAKDGGYLIRSLYFDTMQERDFYEKEDGLEIRRKIRLRTYSPDSDFAMLEMKQKQGEIRKSVLCVSARRMRMN